MPEDHESAGGTGDRGTDDIATDRRAPTDLAEGPDGDSGADPDPTARADTPPEAVVEAAEQLTRRARDAVDAAEAAAYRRDRGERLAEHGYTARVREDETRDVLVLHPESWVEDGTVRTDRIADIDRGVEIPLSGPGEAADWEAIEEHNRDLVAAVRDEHGEVHGANASALADFMSNHYAKPVEDATGAELEEFLTDYYPRNAWPTDEQRSVVKKSVRLMFDAADVRPPFE